MKLLRISFFIASLCCAATAVQANSIITNPGPGGAQSPGGNTNGGYDFTIGSTSISVTALGLWDENGDGFTNPHAVGLWDNSGNLLAKVVLSSGTLNPLMGEFRYATLVTPITLTAGTTYVMAGAFLDGDADRARVNFFGNQATFDPAIIPGDARESFGSFSFPSQDDGPGSIVGPNALFTLLSNGNGVPEAGPGLLLFALVLVGIVFAHRRLLA